MPKVISSTPATDTRNSGSRLSLAWATPSGYRQNCKKPMAAPANIIHSDPVASPKANGR
ncbi:hypothetical protein D3C76_1618830 [compost metagenome]